jgi:hypothetical protein
MCTQLMVVGRSEPRLEELPISHKIFPHEKLTKPDPPKDGERPDFKWMIQESKLLASLISVEPKQIWGIFKASSDWEFIIKIDALLEAAAKRVVSAALATDKLATEDMEEFIDGLPMRGRTSLLKLLEAAGCGEEERRLIDCVRILRNGFAHDITQMDLPLIEVVKRRKDKSALVKGLCWIQNYDEAELIKDFEKDGGRFRFSILSGVLTFMILAYHNVVDPKDEVLLGDEGEASN